MAYPQTTESILAQAKDEIAETLRTRVLRGLQSGALRNGERLPSARNLETEFGVDHRVVLAAYRQLETEGLVELRTRGGVYVRASPAPEGALLPPPQSWLVEVFTQALLREVAAPELVEWLRGVLETLRLRAVVIARTSDQVDGLCRELRDDFGLEVDGLLSGELSARLTLPLSLRRADLIVTTEAHAIEGRRIAADLRKAIAVIEVRPDLVAADWRLLLRRQVFVVAATVEFAEMLTKYFAEVPGFANMRILVV